MSRTVPIDKTHMQTNNFIYKIVLRVLVVGKVRVLKRKRWWYHLFLVNFGSVTPHEMSLHGFLSQLSQDFYILWGSNLLSSIVHIFSKSSNDPEAGQGVEASMA